MADPADTPLALTLGSASPRRADLLTLLGINFDVDVVDLDEHALIDPGEQDPRVIVEKIARAKFAAFPANHADVPLLTADTLVACHGAVMGKPATNVELIAMLGAMSARDVHIVTAVVVGRRGQTPQVETVTTVVALRPITPDEIQAYVATGVGMDKAGGLALQAQAKPFIEQVRGCWSNVLGLPLCAVSRLTATSGSSPTTCSVELCGSHEG